MSVPLPAILTQAHNLPKEMNNLWLPSISLGFLDLVEFVQALSPLNLPRAICVLLKSYLETLTRKLPMTQIPLNDFTNWLP